MRKLYVYETSAGAFYIAEHNGHFHPVFQEESLEAMPRRSKQPKTWPAVTRSHFQAGSIHQTSASLKSWRIG